jgi:hypothetical protein
VQSGTNSVSPLAKGVTGNVHGGQQPVAFSTVQLYTVGTTADGSAATPLLTQTVTSDAGGNFSLTGLYSCTGATLVYLTATGGQPIPGTTNPNLAMMTALGPCSSLTPSTFIQINEVTTVAAVAALAPFMTGYAGVGSASGDAVALASAFTLASELANTATGQAPGANVPPGLTVPTALMNTLANVVAACVNSAGGAAGDNNPCGNLFALTTPSGGVAPADTIKAMLYLAQNPGLNTPALFNLITPAAPFQPQLTTAPTDFHVQLIPATAPTQLQLSTSGLTFTGTAVGFMSAALPVTILNNGVTAVTFSVIGLTGMNAGDFAQTNNCASPLAAGASCTVQVTTTPTATGARYGYLSIASSTPDSPQYVSLAATGTVPAAGPVTLSATSLSFSTANTWYDVTLSNFGTTPLTIRNITATGEFFSPNNCGAILPAQSICTISVQSFGTDLNVNRPLLINGTLTVDDDAATGPQTISLSSFNYQRSNGPIVFGSQAVGYGVTLPLTFTALLPVNFTQIFTVTSSGANAGDFTVSPSSCNGSGLGCSVLITFKPTATGVRTAKLAVTDGLSEGAGFYIPVSGTGMSGPAFVFSGPSVVSQLLDRFGNANTSSYVQVMNDGTTTLSFTPGSSAFSFTGTNGSNFTLGSISSCGPVVPLATCTAGFNFAASAVGSYTASFVATDQTSGYSQSFPITVNVGYHQPIVAPTTLTFPLTALGSTSATQTFTVTDGTNPLGHPISVALQASSNFILPAGSTCAASTSSACTLSVAFKPVATGSISESLTVTDMTSGLSTTVQLNGPAGTASLSLSPSPLTFAQRAAGSTSVPTPITLTNTGTAPFPVSGVSLTGAVNGNFTQSNNCVTGFALSPGQSCTINVTFAPSAPGTQSATIQVISGAASSPDTVTVSGTAN